MKGVDSKSLGPGKEPVSSQSLRTDVWLAAFPCTRKMQQMTVLYKDKARRNGRWAFTWLSRKSTLSPLGLIAITFAGTYLIAVFLISRISSRDPTSYFFDSRRAYERGYSTKRLKEAENFIATADTGNQSRWSSLDVPLLCVGVATVARRDDQYVSYTVGSLLEGLSKEERSSIFINILIAHTEPAKHPAFSHKWIQTLPDRVLEYRNDSAMFDQLREWEETGQYRNKTIYDYTYLLQNCYDTGAEYVAMIEDDTIAVRGWYQRAMDAVQGAETFMRSRSTTSQWIYLRLFFSDDLLGWNSEDWQTYLFWSFAFWAISTASLVLLRKRYRKQLDALSLPAMVLISGVCLPAVVGLYFLAGRQTVLPIKPPLQEMNKYGCCSQGLVFPRFIIPPLLSHTDLQTDWLVDMMIEQIADREGWARWAVVPSLLQHIGVTSSKGYGFDDSARHLWNFRFEQYT